jgi:DNA-binding XRE family transcriptional regulator/predicted GIY-YIG superfamily endonuclease
VTWYVYALKDPRDDAIRYVGKSSNPAKRLASHCSKYAAAPVRAWVEDMRAPPELDVLASVATETEALLLERGWITRLRASGAKLINGTVGGERPGHRHGPRFVGIGERIRAARLALSLTQQEVARLAGVEAPKICRIEKGGRTQITAESAVLIARALRTTVEWLVTGESSVVAAAGAR